MTNSTYNFGLISGGSSLNNLKSFTVSLNSDNLWVVNNNNLKDYFVEYYNRLEVSNGPGTTEYAGLVVYNKKGKNFVILVQNALQQDITQANFISFTGPGTIPNLNNLGALISITYPELPTFINGYNGYNIPRSSFNTNISTYTFYIMD